MDDHIVEEWNENLKTAMLFKIISSRNLNWYLLGIGYSFGISTFALRKFAIFIRMIHFFSFLQCRIKQSAWLYIYISTHFFFCSISFFDFIRPSSHLLRIHFSRSLLSFSPRRLSSKFFSFIFHLLLFFVLSLSYSLSLIVFFWYFFSFLCSFSSFFIDCHYFFHLFFSRFISFYLVLRLLAFFISFLSSKLYIFCFSTFLHSSFVFSPS